MGATIVRQARVACAAVLLLMSAVVVRAGSDDSVVARWYALLTRADAAGLSSLLADDARIHLGDIGVDQTKAEFIQSMGEWAHAVKGATIRHRIESQAGELTTVLACYDFPGNDMLVRETFTIRDGRVADNAQTTVSEDCAGY